jgi:hypothetical protein
MNYQPEEDLQRRLQQLEADINSSSPKSSQSQNQQTNPSKFGKFNALMERSRIWFQGLSGVNKLVVSGAAIFVSFLLLQTVFKLVASLISMALLIGLVYLGYKFFVSNSSQSK